MSEKVLQLFSGGKDSFLSTYKLAEQGYNILFTTYKDGCSLCSQNTEHEVERLIKKYGEKVHFLGCYAILLLEFGGDFFAILQSKAIRN